MNLGGAILNRDSSSQFAIQAVQIECSLICSDEKVLLRRVQLHIDNLSMPHLEPGSEFDMNALVRDRDLQVLDIGEVIHYQKIKSGLVLVFSATKLRLKKEVHRLNRGWADNVTNPSVAHSDIVDG